MANIKWSGIESWKYGLMAHWYVSAYYGNDVDVDGVGYYNPTTNVTGHGGPTRPFASLSKLNQDSTVVSGATVLFDGGYYSLAITAIKPLRIIGDGTVIIANTSLGSNSFNFYNTILVQCTQGAASGQSLYDCTCIYSSLAVFNGYSKRTAYFECTSLYLSNTLEVSNCTFVNCSTINSGGLSILFVNNIIINSPNFYIQTSIPRLAGIINDYSIIIGTVRSSRAINGKTTGITVEDFKVDGNYFVKSFSEVDLFGNASGSGATVAQLQTIFNNYFSPIYLDTWQFADLSLKPTANEKVRFGGLNGTYIGAKPVGYYYSAATLWTNRNQTNTVDIEVDSVTGCLQIAGTAEYGTYESNEIDLGKAIQVDPVNFLANLVYNSDGTAKQGVANQRIDTNPDATPDNTLNQRVVYDYQLAWSPNDVDALSAFKNFELNRKPTIDASGDTQLDDNFTVSEQTYITVRRFKVKFVLRKIVIN